jgi:hypothetical protein
MSLRHIEHIDDQTYEIHVLKDEPVDAPLPIMSALLGHLIESSKLIHTRFGKGQDAVKDIEAKVSAIEETR